MTDKKLVYGLHITTGMTAENLAAFTGYELEDIEKAIAWGKKKYPTMTKKDFLPDVSGFTTNQ